jgi:hypothetical protein
MADDFSRCEYSKIRNHNASRDYFGQRVGRPKNTGERRQGAFSQLYAFRQPKCHNEEAIDGACTCSDQQI